ncbi:MAG: grpE 2 [Spartobacteria bacterium]|nr:grpE 2 [Spartobacteria bacterium]
MSNAVPTSDEFAAAMQQLSAEAEKTLPPNLIQHREMTAASSPESSQRSDEFDIRFKNLEETIVKKIEDLAGTLAQNKGQDMAVRFRKIDEQLAAIRSSESVNQRLFDSLHEELLKYRDNFLHESLQKPFIHDLVHLYDDLNSLAEQLRTNAGEQKKRGAPAQWRDNLENSIHSLVEILHRFDVIEIEPKETVDRTLHRVVSYEPADFPEEDGQIIMRLKRGFFWRGRLIRPEEVIAKRYG